MFAPVCIFLCHSSAKLAAVAEQGRCIARRKVPCLCLAPRLLRGPEVITLRDK